jgi:hypothetical protein
MKTSELELFLKNLFTPELFDDYCPNGLQIEGRSTIKKLFFPSRPLANQLNTLHLIMPVP